MDTATEVNNMGSRWKILTMVDSKSSMDEGMIDDV